MHWYHWRSDERPLPDVSVPSPDPHALGLPACRLCRDALPDILLPVARAAALHPTLAAANGGRRGVLARLRRPRVHVLH